MSTEFPGSESVGRIIDGRFRLIHWLGRTERSSVFLTQLEGETARQAAIKFVAADDARRMQWEAARNLSYPDLIRVFGFGRCQLDGEEFEYILTEFAEEVLSEILAERPLTTAETAEMLSPIVDALECLHTQGVVHGGLRPSNILAAGERLKLSVDGIEAAGERGKRFHPPSAYDAPERSTENSGPEMDVWSLGILLVEALTRQTPAWNRAGGGEPVVPSNVPEPLASIARACLRVDPARRCTVAEISARLEFAPIEAPVPDPAPAPAAARATKSVLNPAGLTAPQSRSRVPVMVAILAVLIVGVVTAAVEMHSHRAQAPPGTVAQNSMPVSNKPPQVADAPARGGLAANGAVVRRVMPEVPQAAMATIQGHVRVGIRVEVGTSGDVSNAEVESPGPSRYFAQFALNAARGWKFRPAKKDGRAVASAWALHFTFGATGVEVTPIETQP